MEYKDYVKELTSKCNLFLEQVEGIGNECAYTDSLLEDILMSAARLNEDYYKSNDGLDARLSDAAIRASHEHALGSHMGKSEVMFDK